jgi:hypothetical protein
MVVFYCSLVVPFVFWLFFVFDNSNITDSKGTSYFLHKDTDFTQNSNSNLQKTCKNLAVTCSKPAETLQKPAQNVQQLNGNLTPTCNNWPKHSKKRI